MSVKKFTLATNFTIATILIQLILTHSQTFQLVYGNTTTSKSDANHKLQPKSSTTNNNQTTIVGNIGNSNSNNSNGLDEILRDTFQLLDSLDQKLDQVNNKTKDTVSTGSMRELRLLDDDEADNKALQIELGGAGGGGGVPVSLLASNYRLKDEELTQLAQDFSSERRLASSGGGPGEPLATSATSNNEQRLLAPPPSAAAAATSKSSGASSGPTTIASEPIVANTATAKRARQLNLDDDLRLLASGSGGSANNLGKFDNDFTEKHIRFTLDMMRAIFSSQSYSTKTNSLDSFLISPVSVQLVLMMMHLAARGQTKRELSNTLHFLSSSPTPAAAAATTTTTATSTTTPATEANHSSLTQQVSGTANQQQQHHEFTLGLLANQNGANLSSNNSLIKNSKLTRRNHHHVSNKQAQHNQRQQQQQQTQASPVAQNNNVHEQFGAAMRQLLKDSTVVRALTSANQIFLQKDLPLSPQYEWAVKHYYGADLKQVDFQNQSLDQHHHGQQHPQPKSNANLTATGTSNASGNSSQQVAPGANIQATINEWVERQTRGKISNFLSAPVPTSTLLMALNVLFYKGDWQYKFDPADTDPDAWFTQTDGKTVKVPMMVNKLPLAHAHDPIMKTSVIELPYKAQRLGLFILLPDEVNGIFETMQMLNSSSFANLISMMRKTAPTSSSGSGSSGGSGGSSGGSPSDVGGGGGINVRIPKFSIESSPRLSQILSQQLGLKTLFSPDLADLSGMFANPMPALQRRSNQSFSGPDPGTHQASQTPLPVPPQVGLDELLHKAVLQVHEQGSIAAAASATIVERVGLFNGQYFEADHPFLLFLMDKQTGLVLFSGVFAGPTGLDTSHKNSHQSPLSPIGGTNLTAPTIQGADSHTSRNPKAAL